MINFNVAIVVQNLSYDKMGVYVNNFACSFENDLVTGRNGFYLVSVRIDT